MSGDTGFDYIVVGAGSSGCAAAARLTEDPAISVLLLEAGPVDDHPRLSVPIAAGEFLGSELDWAYRSEPEPGLHQRQMDLAHGKVLGGSSAINSMLYLRGPAGDFDQWAQGGATGWSYAEVLPYFKRAEDYEGGGNHVHGNGGPLAVSRGQYRHDLGRAFLDAAAEAGYPRVADLNVPAADGFGCTPVTQRDGRRCSAASAYLTGARARSNLRIETNTTAVSLTLDGNRVLGVSGRTSDGRHADFQADEVLLAAGAYHSPELLLRAGIGPSSHLAELGIPLVADLPVGKNLQDHLRVAIVYRSTIGSLFAELDGPAWNRYERAGTGPFSSNAGEAAGYLRSSSDVESPDFIVCGVPSAVGAMLDTAGDGVTLVGWHARPQSRGHVRLRSADPGTPPCIQHNYLTAFVDQQVIVNGVRRMLDIAAQPSFQKVVTGEPINFPQAPSDAAVLAWARETGLTVHHPCGTCAIGQVVDTDLRVYGTEGLRVIDASVMPTIVGGATNAASIMIGERSRDLIRTANGTS
jgi:choline dehydrogenase-like flavoprotein